MSMICFFKSDPRVKLLGGLFWILLAFSIVDLRFLCSLFLITIFVCILAHKSWQQLKIPLFVTILIGIQFLVMQIVFGREGEVSYWFGFLPVYSGSVMFAFSSTLQMGILVISCLEFLRNTTPIEITLMLEKMGLPYRYATLSGLALRFLPLMERELKMIYESQQVRGVLLATPWQKIRYFLPILMPLLYRSFRRANETALTMELKGFGYAPQRTYLENLKLTVIDKIYLGFFSCLLLGLGIMKIYQ